MDIRAHDSATNKIEIMLGSQMIADRKETRRENDHELDYSSPSSQWWLLDRTLCSVLFETSTIRSARRFRRSASNGQRRSPP